MKGVSSFLPDFKTNFSGGKIVSDQKAKLIEIQWIEHNIQIVNMRLIHDTTNILLCV